AARDLAQRRDQSVDVLDSRADAERCPDRARDRMMLATAEALPDGVGVRDAHAEQMGDVRVRAEAAVANPDCILRAEDRRHEGVMHAVDGERAHAEPVDVESIPEAEPVQLREIVDLTVEVREQSLLVRSAWGR